MKLLTQLLSISFTLLLVGCGGGSDGSTQEDTPTSNATLNGIAAVGAPLQSANITVKGALGLETTTVTFSDGTFSVDVSNLTAPYLLRAIDLTRGIELYSYSESVSNVNITPVTSLIMSQALPSTQTLQDLFDDFASMDLEQLEADINTQISELNALVGDDEFSGFNHFTGSFSANSTGYDGILDELNFTYSGTSITLMDDSNNALATTNEVMLSGRVLDDNSQPIEGATVTATEIESGDITSTTTNANGEYQLTVLHDQQYTIEITSEGYEPVVIKNVDTDTQSSDVSLNSVQTTEETALVNYSANIIDATSGNTAVSGVQVTIRSDLDNQTGDIVDTATSNASGAFTFNGLQPGNYTLELNKTHYHTHFENIFVNSSVEDGQLFIVPQVSEPDPVPVETTPVITSMTITLQWNEYPVDLDTHLTGPQAASSTRFHVQYDNKCWADTTLNEEAVCDDNATVILDRDDVTSYGPETIRINEMTTGSYHFYVHHADYPSLGEDTSTGFISQSSGAIVKVIDNYGRSFTFNAPTTGGEGADDIWHVFSTDDHNTPVPINNIEAHDSDVTDNLD